jgi:hypothetical protein
LLVIAMLAGMFAGLAGNRRFRAGLWLGAAVCLKAIPGFLGLFLLLRRDNRAVLGAAAAVAIGLFVIPAAVWGPRGAVDLNLRMLNGVIAPGVGADGDQTLADELTNDVATDSQSFRAVIHNWRYPDRATRPAASSRETGLAHWAISAGLTLATVVVAMRRSPNGRDTRPMTTADQLVLFGGLVALMLVVTPVSHMHYYAYGLPLVCGLWLQGMAERPWAVSPGRRTVVVLVCWGVATTLPLFPWEWAEFLRQFGFGTAATVGLWAYALAVLGCGAKEQVIAEPQMRRAA